jgi:hypothetical protein
MNYQKSAKDYATLYGRNERTIKRWKANGWPLDDEPATRALIAAHGRDNSGPRLPSASLTSPAAPRTAGRARPQGAGETGLKAAIQRMQQADA